MCTLSYPPRRPHHNLMPPLAPRPMGTAGGRAARPRQRPCHCHYCYHSRQQQHRAPRPLAHAQPLGGHAWAPRYCSEAREAGIRTRQEQLQLQREARVRNLNPEAALRRLRNSREYRYGRNTNALTTEGTATRLEPHDHTHQCTATSILRNICQFVGQPREAERHLTILRTQDQWTRHQRGEHARPTAVWTGRQPQGNAQPYAPRRARPRPYTAEGRRIIPRPRSPVPYVPM